MPNAASATGVVRNRVASRVWDTSYDLSNIRVNPDEVRVDVIRAKDGSLAPKVEVAAPLMRSGGTDNGLSAL